MPEVLEMIYNELTNLRDGQGKIYASLNNTNVVAHEANQRSKTNRWLIGIIITGVIAILTASLPVIVSALGG